MEQKRRLLLLLVALGLLSVTVGARRTTAVPAAIPYQQGFPRTEPKTIEFASPSVVDINGDGKLDALTADGAGCVYAWNASGSLLAGFPLRAWGSCSNTPRINGPLAIGDVDGDGRPEIVAGTRGAGNAPGQRGRVLVWKGDGSLLPGWPKEMDWNDQYGEGTAEVYTVALANMSGDARLEIVAGTSNNAALGGGFDQDTRNLYAWYGNSSLLPGYPTWYRDAGIWGFIGTADLTGDGYAELITGRDHVYLHAYGPTGQHLPNWPVRTYVDLAKTKWGVDPYIEFTRNAPSMGDLDGNGTVEIVIAGKVRDPLHNHAVTGSAILVVLPDGTRKAGWLRPKLSGPPIAEGFSPSQAPALADLTGDGKLEIVVTLTDGTVRAYRLNGDLLWQYDYAQGNKLFASEAVIGDVTGDGKVDVIFGTYSPDGSASSAVGLHGLDGNGQPLPNFPLALTHEGNGPKQGIRAAPTLADLDGDCDVEILAASWAGTLYVWDLPAPYHPDRMPWPTGRQNNQRTGAIEQHPSPAKPASHLPAGTLGNKAFLPLVATGCH